MLGQKILGTKGLTRGLGGVGWDECVSLCVKFDTSRMLSSGIFWWGYCCCSCCCCSSSFDRGKIMSTPSSKSEAWTLDWSLTIFDFEVCLFIAD